VPRISAAIATQSNARNAWHIYPVLLDPGVDRSLVRARLHERGVQTSIHYPPLHQTRAFASADDGLPVTEDYARRTMTIPLFPHLTEAQQGEVIDALAEAVATG
jgi:dTDP-4-amino-4,6-dideoxygalactose transaminase